MRFIPGERKADPAFERSARQLRARVPSSLCSSLHAQRRALGFAFSLVEKYSPLMRRTMNISVRCILPSLPLERLGLLFLLKLPQHLRLRCEVFPR
jgi:hypothetical protein